MLQRPRRAVLFALTLLLHACGLIEPEVDALGTVRFIDIEGGCWVIDTPTQRFEPINLSSEFRIDGVGVLFQANERPDLASVCQAGRIVELTSIHFADEPG